MTDGVGSPFHPQGWLEGIVKPLSGVGPDLSKLSPSRGKSVSHPKPPGQAHGNHLVETVEGDQGEEEARRMRMKHYLASSALAGAPGYGDIQAKHPMYNEDLVLAGSGMPDEYGGATWLPAAAAREGSISEAYVQLEESLRWAEFELVSIASRWRDDIQEITFWRHAPDKDVAKARAQVCLPSLHHLGSALAPSGQAPSRKTRVECVIC